MCTGTHSRLLTTKMLRFQIILVSLIFASCTTSTQTGKTELEHWTDTIYSSSMRNDPNFYRLTVQITDTNELENPVFEIEKEQAIKVKVWEFDEYPVSIKAKDNVKITEQDSKNGIFKLIPLDSSFTIEIWQNYGTNHVFRKLKFDSGYQVIPENGTKMVAQWRWQVK